MALEALFGLGLGYNYALSIKKESEVKQGKNHYQASGYQIQSLGNLSSLASFILSQIPHPQLRTGAMIGNALMPTAGMIFCPTFAAVKNGHYEQGVKCFDAIAEPYCPKLKGLLPQQLTERSIKLFSFLAEHMGDVTRVGLLAGTVALPLLGFGSLAAGIAGPIVFDALDSANMVPSKISTVVEKYMPTVANASLVVGGGLFSKALALVTLASGIPGASTYAQKKIEKIFFKTLFSEGPSLEEIDAPWKEKNDLTFKEINYILDNDDPSQYEINLAHCSKEARIAVDIPEDRNFKSFMSLFEKINWKERYQLLKRSLQDDDRFLDLLKQKFPEQSYENLRLDFEKYVEKLAVEIGMTKEEFLVSQLKEQMDQLVMVLCKEKTPKGFQEDLLDAMDASSQILAYLLSKPVAQVEVEDILLKLAIEGGDYCARGVKRAAMEISSGIILQGLQSTEDPMKNYELKIRQQLQLLRQQIMQNTYQKAIEALVLIAKDGVNPREISKTKQTTDSIAVAIAQDVHTMDLYRHYLALGFYPLTHNERSRFGIQDFLTWKTYQPILNMMYAHYQNVLDQAIKEEGEVNFSNYLRQKIFNLQHLSPEQQEILIEKLTECREGEKTLISFHRLFFVMQGVLKIKPIYSDWAEIPDNEPSLSNEEVEKEFSEWEIVIK